MKPNLKKIISREKLDLILHSFSISISRCIVGDYVTEGDGNGKKTSKTHAAELMIEKLKELPPVASCQTSIESSQPIKDLGPNMHITRLFFCLKST